MSKTKHNSVFITVGVIIMVLSAGYLGFSLGVRHTNMSMQTRDDKIQSLESELETVRKSRDYLSTDNIKLTDDYNKLVGDFNTLLETTKQYVANNTYQPRQSLNCTSNTIGSSVYTNCY